MAQYVTCELCGAHLDFGEKCDCTKKEGEPPQPEHPKGIYPTPILHHNSIFVNDRRRGYVP